MFAVRHEFEHWRFFRKFANSDGERLGDKEVDRLAAQLHLEEERFFEAYQSYWCAEDEIGKKAVYDALLEKIKPSLREEINNLHLAECIALENGYPVDEIFESYMLRCFFENAMNLAENVKNTEWLDKATIARVKDCLQDYKYGAKMYSVPSILKLCSKNALRILYPVIIESKQTNFIEQCAEALDDEEMLQKLARKSFGWFGSGQNIDRALRIWKQLRCEKGLRKIQRWAKRNLEHRAREYYEACRALGDEQGRQELLDKIFSGSLGKYMYCVEDGLREDNDLINLNRLAQYYSEHSASSRALVLFAATNNKDGILCVLNTALAEKSYLEIGDLWETKDRDILTKLKELAIQGARLADAEMYAKKLGESLTTEDYLNFCELEREKIGYVNEYTAREAGITLQAEDYMNMARAFLKEGIPYLAEGALRKAVELQKKNLKG